MDQFTLIIGNKNYSSWSMRPWLVLKHLAVPFHEIRLPVSTDEFQRRIHEYSPTGKVPVLRHGKITIWDSLAICEYLAECFPLARLWPENPWARAVARAVSAEMHAGFQTMRNKLPMNIRRQLPVRDIAPDLLRDIDRVVTLWQECRASSPPTGPFLFGHFTIADAMYAPVALRFQTYGIALPPVARTYADTLLALPSVQEWCTAAGKETETIPQYEPETRTP